MLYVLPSSQSDTAISSLAKYPPTSTAKAVTEQQPAETTSTDGTSPERQGSLSFDEFDSAEEVASLLISDANEKSASEANEVSASEEEDRFKVPGERQRGRRKQSAKPTRRLRSSSRKKTMLDYTKYSDDEYDAHKYPTSVD